MDAHDLHTNKLVGEHQLSCTAYDGLLSACMLLASLMHACILGEGNYCLLFEHAYASNFHI
jgi:hypothetical protein